MPAVSVDTFLACSLMVILVLSAMAGLSTVLYPCIDGLSSNGTAIKRYEQLAKYLLSNTGTPNNWGCFKDALPSSFGLAENVNPSQPYSLDIDKVSRLNSENAYSITYAQLLNALGTSDVALRIEMKPLFELHINLTSTISGEDATTYGFEVSTERSSMPIQSELSCYAVARNYVATLNSSTASNGRGFVNVTIPNSANGTVLFIAFAEAKVDNRIVSFSIYSFDHKSTPPQPNGAFTRLSPLNHTLNVSFLYPNEEVSVAKVFTHHYSFNLTRFSSGTQWAEYGIPCLLDVSPMVLIVTGFNDSSYFAEWVAYPQLPLAIGANFDSTTLRSGGYSFVYVVAINSALYECIVKCGGPNE